VKPYYQYIEDVKNGNIIVCDQIKQAVARFEEMKARDDIYFDEDVVDDCIRFVSLIKHFKGKSAGKSFILEPWQSFIFAYIFGLKWKETGYRVVREVYIQIARKAGKDAMVAIISLIMLLLDGEASPEIVCAANAYPQAKILFEYIDKFAKCIDVKKNLIKHYKEKLTSDINNGSVKVVSSDASRLDGLNISCAVIDEFHEAKDRKVYDVLRSSQLQRTQPLTIVITTAGFNIEGPCHDMYKLAIEVLSGVKTLDNFAAFIYQLDPEDDWTDSSCWLKCQPNLGVTVDIKSMEEERDKALVDSTAKTGVLTKTFNKWVMSSQEWIPLEIVSKCLKKISLRDFEGMPCVCGLDLGAVSDITALNVLINKDGINYYLNWCFLPNAVLETHPQRYLYEKFIDEGSLTLTPGNVTDFEYIINKIAEINKVCPIQAIYSDMWNAVSTMTQLQDMGFNVEQFSQAIGNFNGPTKSLETQIRSNKCVIQASSMILWQFSNAIIKRDANGNEKITKDSYKGKKVDSLIAMCESTGGSEKTPFIVDTEIFVF